MRETARPLALKPYLDAVEHLCDSLSKKQLTQLVLHFAGDIPARERASYLDALHRALGAPRPHIKASDIVDRIAGLHDDIRERSEAIAKGEYPDDYDAYESAYDEGPDALSAEQKEDLEDLFNEADALFLSHNLKDAERAYGELHQIFSDSEVEYLAESEFDSFYTMDRDELALTEQRENHREPYFVKAICAALSDVSVDRETRRKYEKWARAKAESRVRDIVSNQHRSAYGRAAQTLAALAEYYARSGRPTEAHELVSRFRDVEFRRHRAFREELDAVTRTLRFSESR
ncbi:MAG: hypothetical protein GF331_21770 [Chitinivibrionales bacterium]|nr:hypothetical protein [Chitinivibrionales bacterium]